MKDLEVRDEGPRKCSSIDRGWAWVVAAGILLWNSIVSGTIKTSGVFYLEFLVLYNEGAVATSWIAASFALTLSVTAPLSGLFKDKCSHNTSRMVVVVCGIVAAASLVACAWTQNTASATVLFGVMTGLAASASDPPILSCIGLYFIKYRVFANCIAFTGSSIGGFVLPLFFTWAIETYAVRGALILMGGLWLHGLVVAAIIRPLSASDYHVIFAKEIDPGSKDNLLVHNDVTSSMENPSHSSNNVFNQHPGCTSLMTENSAQPVGSTSEPHQNMEQTSSEMESQDLSNKATVIPKDTISYSGKNKCMEHVKDYWSFIKTPGLLLLCSVFVIASFAYFGQFFIIPPLVAELGMGKEFASLILTVLSIVELVSRLIFGFLIEKLRFKKPLILCGSFTISAVATFLVSYMTSESWLVAYGVVMGLFGGLFSPMIIPMLMEISPADKFGTCAGLYPFLIGIGSTICPPIISVTKQRTGTYRGGLLVLAGAYVLVLLVLAWKCFSEYRRTRSIK